MVRQFGKTLVDTRASDHRADLDAALPGHRHQLWVRVPQGVSGHGSPKPRRAIRHQSGRQPALHADLFRDEERATGGGGHLDRLGYHHLVCGRCLAAFQIGRRGPRTVFRVGVDCDGAANEYHLDELGEIMIHKPGVLPLLLILMGSFVMAEETPQTLFDFTNADAAKAWQNVNDGVMGGVSEGKLKITDKKTLEFYGTLSLENNGGFASLRTKAKKLGLQKGDTVVAKIRGDGREYTLNLYLNKPLIAFSYRATFQTKKDEWIEVKVPLDKFEPTSFGRVLKDAGSVKPEEVNSLGFMLSDKRAGPFKMEIESIQVERAGTPK